MHHYAADDAYDANDEGLTRKELILKVQRGV